MLKPSKFIIYRRISSIKQEESGLGLDAQMNEITIYISQKTMKLLLNLLKLRQVKIILIDLNY